MALAASYSLLFTSYSLKHFASLSLCVEFLFPGIVTHRLSLALICLEDGFQQTGETPFQVFSAQ
jgi:hypothetical protein